MAGLPLLPNLIKQNRLIATSGGTAQALGGGPGVNPLSRHDLCCADEPCMFVQPQRFEPARIALLVTHFHQRWHKAVLNLAYTTLRIGICSADSAESNTESHLARSGNSGLMKPELIGRGCSIIIAGNPSLFVEKQIN